MNRQQLIRPSEQELNTLMCMYQNHPKRRCRQRAHVILLVNEGYNQEEIANIVKLSRPTVNRCLQRYLESGFVGLYDAPIPGRPRKRSRAVKNSDIEERMVSLGIGN